MGISLVVFASLLNSAGHFLFKSSVPAGGRDGKSSALRSGKFWGGLGIYLATTLLGVYAFRFGDLTLLGPLTNLVLVWNLLLARRLFGDRIGPQRVAATVLILAGCIVVAV